MSAPKTKENHFHTYKSELTKRENLKVLGAAEEDGIVAASKQAFEDTQRAKTDIIFANSTADDQVKKQASNRAKSLLDQAHDDEDIAFNQAIEHQIPLEEVATGEALEAINETRQDILMRADLKRTQDDVTHAVTMTGKPYKLSVERVSGVPLGSSREARKRRSAGRSRSNGSRGRSRWNKFQIWYRKMYDGKFFNEDCREAYRACTEGTAGAEHCPPPGWDDISDEESDGSDGSDSSGGSSGGGSLSGYSRSDLERLYVKLGGVLHERNSPRGRKPRSPRKPKAESPRGRPAPSAPPAGILPGEEEARLLPGGGGGGLHIETHTSVSQGSSGGSSSGGGSEESFVSQESLEEEEVFDNYVTLFFGFEHEVADKIQIDNESTVLTIKQHVATKHPQLSINIFKVSQAEDGKHIRFPLADNDHLMEFNKSVLLVEINEDGQAVVAPSHSLAEVVRQLFLQSAS